MMEKLLLKLKGSIPDTVISQLPEVAEKFLINSPLRLAHFLSQCSHESGGFTATKENLNYSAERLLLIFPKYFKTLAEATPYHRNPAKIANKVYANRMGNGDEKSGDGFKFSGKGAIQLTGKDNYTAFDKFVPEDILTNPDLVATKYVMLSAAWFWNVNKLNAIADTGISAVSPLTRKINGGFIGLPHRQELFTKFYTALTKPDEKPIA